MPKWEFSAGKEKKVLSVLDNTVIKVWMLCLLNHNKTQYTEVLISVGIMK